MMSLRTRLPQFRQVIAVFAVTAFLVYGWTLYRMLQKLPSWLLYLDLRRILSNFSYALVLNFLECLLVTGLIIALGIILPRKFFADIFVSSGSLLSILGLGYLMYLALRVGQSKANIFPWETFMFVPLVGLIILALAFLLPRVLIVRRILDDFSDRSIILLYLIIPLTVVGAGIILVNNLF